MVTINLLCLIVLEAKLHQVVMCYFIPSFCILAVGCKNEVLQV